MQHRPFQRERLAGRQAAIGAPLAFELLALAVIAKERGALLQLPLGQIVPESARLGAAAPANRARRLCYHRLKTKLFPHQEFM
jgi:hypothetical protein